MKYSANNKPLQCMMTQSTCYKGTREMKVLGVLWHSTGANNPWLKRYVQPDDNASNKAALLKLLGTNTYGNDWNHIYHKAGLNAWIGKMADGTVTTIQTMPWNYRPWGCASGANGSCNSGWIQFEICEDALNDKKYFEAAFEEAAQLTAYLCKLYNLNPKGTVNYNGLKVPVILCHYDSYKLGLGGNHVDVYNWIDKFGWTMDTIRNRVAAILAGDSTTPSTSPTFAPYKIRVTADALNYRAGAGTNYKVNGVITDKGVYTIVDEKKDANGMLWGKLKSGAGWISLKYTKKL